VRSITASTHQQHGDITKNADKRGRGNGVEDVWWTMG
jgi:hypothetical protein